MNWIEALYRTYENCAASVGDATDEEPLLPLSHTAQNAHIEVTLDGDGNFRRARILPKSEQRTLIPCTEGSGGRSGAKPTSHPLCDKLQYVAGDFLDFGGCVTSGFSPKEPHEIYTKLLSEWCESAQANPKVRAVLHYVEKGTLISDLVGSSILPLQKNEKALRNEWADEAQPAPEIFRVLPPSSTPQDAFIRWAVEIPGEFESRLWQDAIVWSSWSKFYESGLSFTGLCYVLGSEERLASQHPAKLRHAADKAKLISSNDSSGFTFRGRFTDPEGSQVCGVSFDVTQKAHNALRWLIGRQGRRDGDQAIVAWAVSGRSVPALVESTDRLLDNDEEEDFLADDQDPQFSGLSHAEVAQDFALRLKKKIGGYRAELGNSDKIIVLALDSATPGRMSITYYRELAASEFLDRIEQWHRECAWFQNFGKDTKFIGAPAPKDIATCAYGRRLDEKLQAATQRRLLPCIIENAPVPHDIVASCVRRASARQSMEHWEWEKSLGIACSVYRKHQTSLKHHTHTMSLERDRITRSYLYGRLLAVADLLEGSALRAANEKRDTNAARFMQRFADHPYTTWRNIELSLDPYRRRLQANAPGLLYLYDKEIREIMEQFAPAQFETDEKLEGEFLLAYHTQRTALWTKQPKETVPNNPDENPE